MRILFILPYGPTETRVRSRLLLTELAKRHEITLVALTWNHADQDALTIWSERGVDVRSVPHRPRAWLPGAYRALRQPLQRIISTSPELARIVRRLLAEADEAGNPYDAVHVEHLRGASAANLPGGFGVPTVFDAVDCISELARLTWERNPSPITRLVARVEEEPTRRYERTCLASADVTTVAAERDAFVLREIYPGAQIDVIPNGVTCLSDPVQLVDDPVVIFTGKLSYHANQAAIRWFIDSSWPWVTRSIPDARLVVAGADPPGWLTSRADGRQIQIVANPPDMMVEIARARVAIAPMQYSVGIQNKILEAMAAGVPVIATSAALDGLTGNASLVARAADGERQFAAAVIRMLTDERHARSLGQRGFDYVRLHHSWSTAASRFEALYRKDEAMRWIA